MCAKSYIRGYVQALICMYVNMHVCSANAIAIVRRAINQCLLHSSPFIGGRHNSPKCSQVCQTQAELQITFLWVVPPATSPFGMHFDFRH